MDYENLISVQIPMAAGYAVHPVLERHYSKRVRSRLAARRIALHES